MRWAWGLLAAGAGAYFLGQLAWTGYELAGRLPYPSVADGFSLLFYPFTLAGLLRFPVLSRSRRERLRLTVDLAVVAVGGATVVFYLVLGPTILASGSSTLQKVFSIAYPVGDLVLLVGLASVLLRGASSSSMWPLRLMASGLLVFIVADLLYGWITLNSTYRAGSVEDVPYVLAMTLFALAATAQTAPEAVAVAPPSVLPRVNAAPAVAVAVAFGLLVYNQRGDAFLPDLALVVAAVVLTLLVSARQLLAQRDLLVSQRRLSHQSLHDPLTQLPNRALVIDRAEQLLARAGRNGLHPAALYVDLDGFKNVNDTLGHAAGDELLTVVGQRMLTVVRGSDTVGRMGGDEFVVLIGEPASSQEAEAVAERILDVLRLPFELRAAQDEAVSITASVGVAIASSGSADDLLREADAALYAAKAAGKNRTVLYRPVMKNAAGAQLALEHDLAQAIARNEFFLLYQPIVDLRTNAIEGVEALLRWRHPERGSVAPDSFIPVAEESGLILPIGRWVLEQACAQQAEWRRRGVALTVSVNVSAIQLDDGNLFTDVRDALNRHQVPGRALTLEITETALTRDPQAASRLLRSLKELGVRVAIDDFGTGYSSLAHLAHFPIDMLKIDRSFTADIAQDSPQSTALIHTLIQLGRRLGIETLAEGIEESGQLQTLRHAHCDHGQGFLFARPRPPDQITSLLGPLQPEGTSRRKRVGIPWPELGPGTPAPA